MGTRLPKHYRQFVSSRAGFRCEYCKKPDIIANFAYHLEHIISLQHGGTDHPDNLAYACSWCNWKKGPNIATLAENGIDIIPLFNPRKDIWIDHFKIESGAIIGLSPIGIGTINLLEMNKLELVLERKALIDAGFF